MGKNENIRPLTNAALAILLGATDDALILNRVQIRTANNTSMYYISSKDGMLNVELPFTDKIGKYDYDEALTKIVNYIHSDVLMLSNYHTDNTQERDIRIADIVDEFCQEKHELNFYNYFTRSDFIKIDKSLENLMQTSNAYTGECMALLGARAGLQSMFFDTINGSTSGNYLITEVTRAVNEYSKLHIWKTLKSNHSFAIQNKNELDIEKEKAKIITLAVASLPSAKTRLNLVPSHNNSVIFGITTGNGNIVSANMSSETKSNRSVEILKNKIYKAILRHKNAPTMLLPTNYANKTMEHDILKLTQTTFDGESRIGGLYDFTRSIVNLLPLYNAGKDSNLMKTVVANLAYLSGVGDKNFETQDKTKNINELNFEPEKTLSQFDKNYDIITKNNKAFFSLVRNIVDRYNQENIGLINDSDFGTMEEYYNE